jgi:hypothetical protein
MDNRGDVVHDYARLGLPAAEVFNLLWRHPDVVGGGRCSLIDAPL